MPGGPQPAYTSPEGPGGLWGSPAIVRALTATVLGVCGLALGTNALAATERFNFTIAAQSTPEALIDLAVQSGITVGGGGLCRGRKVLLSGRYSVAEGLDRLLQGSSCRYEFIDPHTVRIYVAPPTPASAKPNTSVVAAKPSSPPPPQTPSEPPLLPEVIVTATKRPGFTGDFPGALSVIGSSQLTNTGVTDTDSIARQFASFTSTNLGPARNKILLRGLSDGAFTGRTQSTVGTYLDDAPITYNAPDPDLRLVDIDHIEILRGPQGALYGAGSLSGIYRIVPQKPQLEETSALAEALAGTTRDGAATTELDATFNTPLGANAAARAVIYSDREGGYLQDEGLRESNVDLTRRSGGRAAVRWLLNDHWEATLSTAVQQLRSSNTQYVILTPDNIRLHRSNQVRETHHNDFAQVALTVAGEGAWGRLLSSTSLVRHDYASRYNASTVLEAFGADPADDLGVFDEAASIRRLVEDVYWSSPERGRWHLTAGVFGSTSLDDTPSSLSARPNEPTAQALRLLYNEARRDSLNEGAAYGVASYDLGGGWVAAMGARAFLTEVHTVSDVMVPPPGQSRSVNERKSFAGVSPKLSLQKQWSNGNYLYGLISTGYRAGGFNTGGRFAPTTTATFRPDHLQNFEIGGEITGLENRLKLHTALFYDHWSDIQTDQYLTSGLSYTANVGDGRNFGWESELSYQLTPNLRVELNGLLDRPQVTSLNPLFTAVRGARLPGVPNGAIAGLITYQRPLAHDRRLVLTAQSTFTGSSRLTFDARFSPLTPSYYSANLSAQLQTPRGRLALFVTNPLNSLSDTFSYGNPFSFGQVRQVTPQRPRTVSVLLSRSF